MVAPPTLVQAMLMESQHLPFIFCAHVTAQTILIVAHIHP